MSLQKNTEKPISTSLACRNDIYVINYCDLKQFDLFLRYKHGGHKLEKNQLCIRYYFSILTRGAEQPESLTGLNFAFQCAINLTRSCPTILNQEDFGWTFQQLKVYRIIRLNGLKRKFD